MTEPTIAEMLAKYPDCKEFVDAKGNNWIYYNNDDVNGDTHLSGPNSGFGKHLFDLISIERLRPKPQKRKVTLSVFLDVDRKNRSLDSYEIFVNALLRIIILISTKIPRNLHRGAR